jgi:hypothetical protein
MESKSSRAAWSWLGGILSTIVIGLAIGDKTPWWGQRSQTAGATTFGEQQSVELIEKYLNSKQFLYGPPYERRLANELLTGEKLSQTNWWQTQLKMENAEYRYGAPKVTPIGSSFVANGDEATIEVVEEEEVSFYRNGRPASRADAGKQKGRVYYVFRKIGQQWRIADSKKN